MMISNLFKKISLKLKKSRSLGATVIEYCLIVSLLGVALIGGYRKVGTSYTALFNQIDDGLNEVDEAAREGLESVGQ